VFVAPELEEEQVYIEGAYRQLDRMRLRSEDLLAAMQGTDPDLEWALLRRVRALADTPRALCFGRIDAEDSSTWYIGRRHVEDEEAEPVVVEWRAPVARPFYRASWKKPMGLTRRRQFVVDGARLLSIGDDHFGADVDQPDAETSGSGGDVRGRQALLIELERSRTGEMLDIVATIQPEQDEVIRAPADGIMAVQGGPGSGKTAVGLHRAAFLLYGDDSMARSNVLVVGPNRTFLRYISQVLPSLGEHAVVQTTLGDLVPEVRPKPALVESPAVEWLKGDGRMADLLATALRLRRGSHGADLEATIGLRRLVISAEEINAMAESVGRRNIPYADGRALLRDRLLIALAGRAADAGLGGDDQEFGRQLRSRPAVKEALDRRWPSVNPAGLVADLLGSPRQLAAAGAGLFSDDERRLLGRRSRSAWTAADGPLVDEAKQLIAGQSRTYGHAIVDEAQDLSPMQLRMIGRRCPSGSITLLGDLAQGVGVWAHEDWRELTAWLPSARVRLVELRYGYRSPGQVLELASRLLPDAAPQVRPTEAVRPGRTAPRQLSAAPDRLFATVVEETARLAGQFGTVAVIVPGALVGPVTDALRSDRTVLEPGSIGEASSDGVGRPVTVVAAEASRGLEFDAVVVVEPSAIVHGYQDRRGLRLLYVVLTRPTQHLSIVATQPLPAALTA
jgi:DNA helicase IV